MWVATGEAERKIKGCQAWRKRPGEQSQAAAPPQKQPGDGEALGEGPTVTRIRGPAANPSACCNLQLEQKHLPRPETSS